MAALVISISLDVSVESMGSSFSRVILIGSIFVKVLVAPEVGAAAVASLARVLELDTHSSSESDPSKSSPPPVFVAPMVSPFLCSDDSESDTEMPKRHVSPIPHDAMLTRWRSRVASRLSSPTTSTLDIPTASILLATSTVVAPSSEFPPAPVVAPPKIHHRRAILIRPIEDIHIGRLYRTYVGGPCRALTVRKSLDLYLLIVILYLDINHQTPPSPFLCSDDSESDTEMPKRHVSPIPHDAMLTRWRSRVASRLSSPTTSTLDIPTASILLATSTVVAPSSEFPPAPVVAPPKIHHRRAILIRPIEDIHIGRLYRTYVGGPCRALTVRKSPSRKRCWSPAATVTSSIHATRALVPSCFDLLPPRKRFRDFISPKDSVEEDVDVDELANIEADATAVEAVVDRDVEAEVDVDIGMEVDVRIDVEYEVEDKAESSDRGTMEVGVDVVTEIDIFEEIPLQRILDIKTRQRELEARSLIAGGERASLLDVASRILLDLRDYWIEILSDKDFLGPAPSYVHIRDPVRRLCHRMIECSISGQGQ
nr:hypothetical protein [Tanacetum cinerariifolium]